MRTDQEIHDQKVKQKLFFRSCKENDLESVEYLIRQGVNIDLINDNDVTVLIDAIESNHPELSKFLIEAGVNIHVQIPNSNETALHSAMESKHYDDDFEEICKLLIMKGASMDIRDKQGRTALAKAIDGACHDLAKFLISNGANLEDYDYKDLSIMDRLSARKWPGDKELLSICEKKLLAKEVKTGDELEEYSIGL